VGERPKPLQDRKNYNIAMSFLSLNFADPLNKPSFRCSDLPWRAVSGEKV